MENQSQDPIQKAIDTWKTFSVAKKSLLIAAAGITLLILFFILSLFGAGATGLGVSVGNTDSALPTQAARDVALYENEYAPSNDAELFETKDYTAEFQTQNLADTCASIDALKPLPNIIFLSATHSDTFCSYQFKVANEEVPSVLDVLTALDPEELTERTTSIKKQIDYSLNQKTILDENLASTEAILAEALVAYDNLLTTATEAQDSTALTQAIRDKLEIIDKLKQRRESTRQQLDVLSVRLAEQQDRLDYSYFFVSVAERVYFDGDALATSWQRALKNMIWEANIVLQRISVGLVSFVLQVTLYAVYLVIVLVIAKFGWRIVRTVWRR